MLMTLWRRLTCAETVKSKGLRFREFINTNDLQLLLTARDYGATTVGQLINRL